MFSIVGIALCLSIICTWYFSRMKRMTILQRNGIPGPKPHLIFGNMGQYFKKGYNQCFEEWKEKYGRIFGFYLGAKPFVVVTDPELLRLIQVKEFTQFFNRPYVVPGGLYRNWKFHQLADRLELGRWKSMRQLMSPWFSSAQLKSMVPIMRFCTDETINKLESLAQTGQHFNIYKLFETLTLDTVQRCAFGVNSDSQKTESDDNKLIVAHRITLSAHTSELLASILLCFPEFSFLINLFRDLIEKVSDYLGFNQDIIVWKGLEAIVDKRIKDFTEKVNNGYKDIIEFMYRRMDETNDKNLAKVEIIANAIGIEEAAYDSTSSILGFCIHHLVNYPEVQDKVYEELVRVIINENKGEIDYEVLNQLPLTEAVVLETFRLYPTDVLFISHSPDSDFSYGSLTIPKGVDIRVPLYQLHRDSEFWSEPNLFSPERFVGLANQKSINPFVYQPFGMGPRLCPGKRFTILEIKLILAKILLKYRLISCQMTEPIDEIKLNFKQFSLSPKNGVFIKIESRDDNNNELCISPDMSKHCF